MTRTMTVLFSAATLGATLYGLVGHSAMLSFVMDTGRPASIICASVVLLVCLYCFVGILRNRLTRVIMLLMGLGLLGGAASSLVSTKLFGVTNYNAMMLDIFLAVQWGILTITVALERPLHSERIQPDWHDNNVPHHPRIKHA